MLRVCRESASLSDAGRAFGARCIDITALLARDGLTATPARLDRKVCYDAPCHLCHAQKVRTAPLELLAQVPGLELVDHPGSEDCCGSAGIYNLLQQDLAGEIGARKAETLVATGATVNANTMHILGDMTLSNGTSLTINEELLQVDAAPSQRLCPLTP